MLGGVVAILSQMQPSGPCFLLPRHIVSEVALHPFVDYLCLSIRLRVIAGARGQGRTNQPNNSCQKVLINLLSLSLTMVLGRPCNLKISLKNSSATCVALKSVAMAKKCANFVNLSTTTNMQSFPCVFGSPVMKSMDMLSHLCSGMGKGCNSPAGCVCSSLLPDM
jgi:hypothetical protein